MVCTSAVYAIERKDYLLVKLFSRSSSRVCLVQLDFAWPKFGLIFTPSLSDESADYATILLLKLNSQ